MKKLILIFLLTFVVNCFADKYYVIIDAKSVVKKGLEASHFEKGDVVTIFPWKPSVKSDWARSELENNLILVMDLTEQERLDLIEIKRDGTDENDPVLKARVRKIEIDNLTFKDLDNVETKSDVLDEVVVKPSSIG